MQYFYACSFRTKIKTLRRIREIVCQRLSIFLNAETARIFIIRIFTDPIFEPDVVSQERMGRKYESFSQFYNADKNVRTSPW